jgi:hypothetical protein
LAVVDPLLQIGSLGGGRLVDLAEVQLAYAAAIGL